MNPRPNRAPLMALCLFVGLAAGTLFDRWMLLTHVPASAVGDFRLMAQAWNTIERYYVDRAAVKPTAMTYGAISGMVDSLGDAGHTVFLPPAMVRQLKIDESGRLKGIGVEIQMKDGHVTIVAPLDNSPAQRAGLRSGDIILGVNGHDIAGLALDEVVRRIAGPVGTPVRLSVLDPRSRRTREIILVRATIRIDSVTWQRLPGTDIADLRIARFSGGVSRELASALAGIERDGCRAVVLDLRENPGGVLKEAVAVASQFVAKGNVLLVKDAKGKVTPVPVRPGGIATRLPVAVLIDNGTASAAEIVAGCLRDSGRGELIGESTFGTGTVLSEFPLAGGSALLLAVEEWLTPDGQSFWHKGLAPQIEVPLPADVLPLTPEAERALTPSALGASKDAQLLRAVSWLRSPGSAPAVPAARGPAGAAPRDARPTIPPGSARP